MLPLNQKEQLDLFRLRSLPIVGKNARGYLTFDQRVPQNEYESSARSMFFLFRGKSHKDVWFRLQVSTISSSGSAAMNR